MALAALNRPLAIRPLPAAASRRVAVCVRAAAAGKPRAAAKPSIGKTALVDAIAETAGVSKEVASKTFDAFIGGVQEALVAGDKVTIVGFGTFEPKERKARTGVNPKTGEKLDIPACKTATFKVAPNLKDTLNGKAPKPKAAAKPAAAKPAAAKPAAAKPAAAKPAAAKPAAPAVKKAAPPKAAPPKK